MKKKCKPENKEYLIFRVYIHRTMDKEICDLLSSMPYALRGFLVKEAIRAYFQKKDSVCEISHTQPAIIRKQQSVLDCFSNAMEGMEYNIGVSPQSN